MKITEIRTSYKITMENDMIIIEVDNGRLYAVIAARIADIEIV